jgi:hypothetical protein
VPVLRREAATTTVQDHPAKIVVFPPNFAFSLLHFAFCLASGLPRSESRSPAQMRSPMFRAATNLAPGKKSPGGSQNPPEAAWGSRLMVPAAPLAHEEPL